MVKIYKIEPTEKPEIKKPERVKEYDMIINDVKKSPKGWYKIEIEGRKPQSVFVALSKRVKKHKDLKIHFIGKQVYIEKTI